MPFDQKLILQYKFFVIIQKLGNVDDSLYISNEVTLPYME